MKENERQVSIEAIVLRHTEFGEADRLIILFSRYQGKIRTIAKGIRKIKSRKAGHLEPFTQSKLLLARGRDFWIITQAESINPHLKLKDDLLLTAYGSYILELVERFMSEEIENPALYNLLSITLQRLERDENTDTVIRYFEIKLLDLLGYKPELQNCVHCRKEILPEDQYFSYQDGGTLCPSCGNKTYSAIPVSLETLKFLRHFQRSKYKDLKNLQLSKNVRQSMEKILQDYLSYLLERKINSLNFIKEARSATAYNNGSAK